MLHEKRSIISTTKGDRVADDAIIPIRIGLKQTKLEHGYDAVMDVSSPTSPNYGKHWSVEEVRTFFGPSEESIAAVKQWLEEVGINHERIGQSEDKAWIAIDIPVRKAEEMLRAEYHEHEAVDGSVRLGCDE